MSMRQSNTPRVFQTRSRAFWVVSWLLVLFYIVASGRAFIPGLCATQRAMYAQCASSSDTASIHPLRSCCSMPTASASSCEKGSKRPITPAESGCALCNLVSSVAPLSVSVTLDAPVDAEHAALPAITAQLASAAVLAAADKRGPPALTHA